MVRFLIVLLLAIPVLARDWYLFTSFRGNGETGVYFALSHDGLTWTPLNENRPFIPPAHPGMLMRDPFLVQGPDGTWHLLWTWGWDRKETGGGLKIGHASSHDLIEWAPQRAIPLLANEPTARNAWAPEAVWDPARKEWIVFWSTTIPGRFPGTDGSGDEGYNHRLYAATTRDWKEFSPARLWFDAGFNSIDATVVRDGSHWVMIFKDERKTPLQKRLRLAFSDSAAGPWHGITEPFSRDWVEGPSAIRIGKDWWIYFDHYARPQHYGAIRTRDWKTFEEVSARVTFPADHRHGTVVRVSPATAHRLEVFRTPARQVATSAASR